MALSKTSSSVTCHVSEPDGFGSTVEVCLSNTPSDEPEPSSPRPPTGARNTSPSIHRPEGRPDHEDLLKDVESSLAAWHSRRRIGTRTSKNARTRRKKRGILIWIYCRVLPLPRFPKICLISRSIKNVWRRNK